MPAKPITLTLKASELHKLIADVMPFADPDRYGLPILHCVHINGHGDHVTSVATDRYVIGVRKVHINAPKSLNVNIDLAVARQMLSMFKKTRKDDPVLTMAFSDDKLTVESGGALDGLILDTRVSFNLYPGEYPHISTVFDAIDTTLGEGSLNFNPDYLAKFKHLGVVTMHPSAPAKACIIRAEDFLGAIMPTRSAGESSSQATRDLSEWDSFRATRAPSKRPGAKKPAA